MIPRNTGARSSSFLSVVLLPCRSGSRSLRTAWPGRVVPPSFSFVRSEPGPGARLQPLYTGRQPCARLPRRRAPQVRMFTYVKRGALRVDNQPRRGVELSQAIARTTFSCPPSPSQGPYHPERRRTHVKHQPPGFRTIVVVVIDWSLPDDIDLVAPFVGGPAPAQGASLLFGACVTSW